MHRFFAKAQPAAGTGYQTKLVPPPDPMEAVLLTTFLISDGDLETLAASRAKAVRAYLLQTGKVEAARLFLKEDQTAGLRSDGSRVYLQFRQAITVGGASYASPILVKCLIKYLTNA